MKEVLPQEGKEVPVPENGEIQQMEGEPDQEETEKKGEEQEETGEESEKELEPDPEKPTEETIE